MSRTEDGRRKTEDGRPSERLDIAIDRAVREMLDVEPPPGLRGRVMARIDLSTDSSVASAFRRKGAWIAVPVAAAALIVLAVTTPWRDGPWPSSTPAGPTSMAQAQPPSIPPPIIAPRPPESKPAVPPSTASNDARRVSAPRGDRIVEAAATAAVEDTNFTGIGALTGPESLVIERLAGPPPPSLPSIEPAALQIRPLEITALPETPRERREE